MKYSNLALRLLRWRGSSEVGFAKREVRIRFWVTDRSHTVYEVRETLIKNRVKLALSVLLSGLL